MDDLSKEAGIEARTIRAYIQQGLLDGPESRGRNAHYTQYHLHRLRNIKILKEFHGLQIKEIRKVLLSLGNQVLTPDSPGNFVGQRAHVPDVSVDEAKSALDYIKLLKGQYRTARTPKFIPKAASAKNSASPLVDADTCRKRGAMEGPLKQLLASLEKTVTNRPVPRTSRGEAWTHIDITPDMKIVIRGDYSADEIAVLERIADTIRQVVLGRGARYDNTD